MDGLQAIGTFCPFHVERSGQGLEGCKYPKESSPSDYHGEDEVEGAGALAVLRNVSLVLESCHANVSRTQSRQVAPAK